MTRPTHAPKTTYVTIHIAALSADALTTHIICSHGYYCAYSEGACKKGEKYCTNHQECPQNKICLRGKCAAKECYYDNNCEGDNECVWPGICRPHYRRCRRGDYDCKNSHWMCLNGKSLRFSTLLFCRDNPCNK